VRRVRDTLSDVPDLVSTDIHLYAFLPDYCPKTSNIHSYPFTPEYSVAIHNEEIGLASCEMPLIVRLFVRVKYRQFAHRPNTSITAENIEYGISKRMPLLPRMHTAFIEGALLFGERYYPNSWFGHSGSIS